MNNTEKYEKWLEMAQYDLETADVMFDSGRYMYVAFMCQQAKEYKEYKTLFSDLTAYYVVGRYSTYKKEISKELDNIKAEELLNKSKEAFTWLKSQVK